MTKFDSVTPLATSPRARATTIFRDIPQTPSWAPATGSSRPSVRALLRREESANGGIFFGFAAMTFLTVWYSFTQLWSLLSGSSLEQAVRALSH